MHYFRTTKRPGWRLAATLALAGLLGHPGTLRSADADEFQALPSRISEVTVFADRAQVTRTATARLATDASHFAFEKLPGWIDEGSVRVALVPAEAGQILDVQVKRTYLKRAGDEEFRKAEEAVREISDQIAALDDEKAVLEIESRHVDSIRTFSLDRIPKDAAVREVKPAEYGETLKFITTTLREAASSRREVEKKRRDLLPELAVRQRKLDELKQTSQLEQRTVIATVRGSAAKEVTLSLTYMTPGATWEPAHELRAAPGKEGVSFASFATVMQTTGEDWEDVQLSLSTQRTTETMRIPELEALLLDSGKRPARVVSTQPDTYQAAYLNFNTQNDLWNVIANPDVKVQREYVGNRAVLVDNSKRIERVFETLQQRGTTTRYSALGRQTIRREGRAVRVPVGESRLAAQHRILAAPELSLNAARTVDLTNETKQPVLPGKVSLFLDGAFLGLTESEFVAPGESFSRYLGVADHIKLSRILDAKRSELKRGGQRTRMHVSFLVSVENLSDQSALVVLNDRLPVSESDEVKVSAVKVQPEAKPDTKGLLKWELNLAARQSKEFRIEYTLDYPTELPQRPAAAPGAPSQSADRSLRLGDEIKSLESKF